MFDISRESFLQFVNTSLDQGDLSKLGILRESGAEKIGFFRDTGSTRISQDIQEFVKDHFDEISKLSDQQKANLTHNLAMLGLKKWNFQNVEVSDNLGWIAAIKKVAFSFLNNSENTVNETAAKLSENLTKYVQNRCERLLSFVLEEITDESQKESLRSIIQEIPPEKRTPTVIQSIASLFNSTTDGSQKEPILRAVQAIPGEQRSDIIEKALPLLTDITDGDEKIVILRSIQEIPGEQRSDIIEKALPLLTGITDGYQKANILRIIQEIPGEQRSDVIEKALPLLTGITDGLERARILRAIQAIPAEQRSDVIEKALPLLTGITDGLERARILRAIQAIPAEQRTPTVIQSIASLFKGITDGYQKENILRIIQEIPGEQRSDVIEKALPLLTGITDGLERACIVLAIQAIPGKQRSDVIEKALPLLTGITDGYQKETILLAIQAIPGKQRSDVIEKALPLLTGITNGFENILRAVQEIPGEQRSDVTEKALPLLTGITDGFERAHILRAIQAIPGEQRSDVIEKALPLLTGITNGSHKVDILRAIQAIPGEQRSDVIEKALPLLTGITDGSHKLVILRAIQEIPGEQRTPTVIQSIASLFKGITDGSHKLVILRAVQEIPGEQRSDVTEKALPLLTGITNGYQKANILRIIQEIPGEQRSDVIEKALPLLTGITDGNEKAHILLAIQAIPGEQRSDVIEKALPLLTGITDGYQKANILRAIQEIPGEQRTPTVIRSIASLFKGITDGFERARILRAVQAIPGEQRSDVIEKALPLLTGITDGDEKLTILRVVQNIPPELRSDVIEKAPLFLESIENGKARAAILKKLAAVSKEIEGDWLDLFSQIAKTRPPSLRHKLADLMLTCLHDGSAKQRFASPQFKTLFSREYMKPFRLLAALLWDEEEPDEELKAAAGVLSSSRYKDYAKKTIVLSSFIALFHTPLLATSEKKRCLGVIFPKNAIDEIERKKIALEKKNKDLKIALRKGPDPSLQEEIFPLRNEIKRLEEEIPQTEAALIDQINQSLSLMESIGNLGFFKNLEKMKKPEDLTHILTALFKEITTVSDIENLSEKYLKTFGASRNPESLFIYAGKLKQLPEEMRVRALNCLKHYVEDVLNGDFFTSRYDEESSIHLKTVFQDNPELKRLWTEGTSVNLEEFCEEDPLSVSSSFDPKKYFMQRVLTDGHISQEKVPYLTAYLTDSNTTQEELSARIQRVTEALERDPENVSLQEELGILRLQRELISLLQSPSSREKLEIYSTGIKPLIEPALRGEKQFKRDLTDLESALASQTKQSSHSGWTVVDSDDPIDLLLCGTDVIGSCQNIHGGPMNRCLIGYLSDGKNRLVAVKNEKGEIAGRSILRILWDPEQRRPVLFKERAYFKPPENKKVSDALDRMCVEKAKKLRLPLVAQVSEQPNVRPYPRPTLSLASRAPFEYSDAGGGATDGTFKVRGVLVADFSTENKRREDV